MTEVEAPIYAVVIPGELNAYACSSLQVAEAVKEKLNVEDDEAKIIPVEEPVLFFDEGRLTAKREDLKNVILNNALFDFYIQDLSALFFTLYRGLNEADEDECVYLNCKIRCIVLSKDDALDLLDYLETNRESLKAEEDAWFENYDQMVGKVKEMGLFPYLEDEWVN